MTKSLLNCLTDSTLANTSSRLWTACHIYLLQMKLTDLLLHLNPSNTKDGRKLQQYDPDSSAQYINTVTPVSVAPFDISDLFKNNWCEVS